MVQNKIIVKARVWIGETDDYTMRYVAPYPMSEKEVRRRLRLAKEEKIKPKADRRMINHGLVFGDIRK